jgi:hypothetical protein
MEVLARSNKYDVRPDTISFNTCIKAWCSCELPNAPHKAEELLSKLETNPQYPNRSGGGKANPTYFYPSLFSYDIIDIDKQCCQFSQ